VAGRYVQVVQGGESFVALSEGLQNALVQIWVLLHTTVMAAAYQSGQRPRKI